MAGSTTKHHVSVTTVDPRQFRLFHDDDLGCLTSGVAAFGLRYCLMGVTSHTLHFKS